MFLGTYTPRLDEKGRFFLPAKFRESFENGLVIARGHEHTLAIYTREEFDREAARAMQGPTTLRAIRDFQRMYAAGASEEAPDKQGRLTIPASLRKYAGLDREIAVIGAINRVEIWDLAAWEAYQAEQEERFAAMDEEIITGGLS